MIEQEAFTKWFKKSECNSMGDALSGWQAHAEWARGQQEPVEKCAWIKDYGPILCAKGEEDRYDSRLYKTPQQPIVTVVRLTDDEIRAALEEGTNRFLANEVPGTLRLQCAYAIMDAMLAKGTAQPAVVHQPTTQAVKLTNDEILKCFLPPDYDIKGLTYDLGPYEITKLTVAAEKLFGRVMDAMQAKQPTPPDVAELVRLINQTCAYLTDNNRARTNATDQELAKQLRAVVAKHGDTRQGDSV